METIHHRFGCGVKNHFAGIAYYWQRSIIVFIFSENFQRAVFPTENPDGIEGPCKETKNITTIGNNNNTPTILFAK